jgi:type II secretory pathway component PulK
MRRFLGGSPRPLLEGRSRPLLEGRSSADLANERGAALIITLFIVALVSILVLEYHFDATVEVELADTYANEVQAHYLAMTGLNLAQVLLQRDAPAYDALDELWSQLAPLTSFLCISPQQLLEIAREQMELQAQDKSKSKSKDKGNGPGSAILGNGPGSAILTGSTERLQPETADPLQACLRLSITDEARKLPINALVNKDTDAIDLDWRQTFEHFFTNFEINTDAVGALIDWIDVGSGHEGDGAEDDYYEGLEHPYSTPDRPMQVPGELRLVRHFDCETLAKLFPGRECKDMADIDLGSNNYLTPFSDGPDTAKVNVNTATEEVLKALTQEDVACVEDILENRLLVEGQMLSKPITDLKALTRCISPNFAKVAGVNSAYFRVEVQGEVGGRIKKKIVAVLKRSGQQTPMKVVYFKVE